MNVVCLVPSWTETLLAAGVNVVGRTRFCIYPQELVKKIKVIGGTKGVTWAALDLEVDLVIFDKEENAKEIAESCPYPWVSTHVTSVDDVSDALQLLANSIQNSRLIQYANRWKTVANTNYVQPSWRSLPGVIEWVRRPGPDIQEIYYVIWKKPWMVVSRNTFIGSVLSRLGVELHCFPEKYPEIDMKNLDPRTSLLLFSSEPYPFGKELEEIRKMGYSAAFVDGEKYSWFGIRSLEFLETWARNETKSEEK